MYEYRDDIWGETWRCKVSELLPHPEDEEERWNGGVREKFLKALKNPLFKKHR